MAKCVEYTCGCIDHPLAGNIRRCSGLHSRSLSGRFLPKPEGAEGRHKEASVERTYDVADGVVR